MLLIICYGNPELIDSNTGKMKTKNVIILPGLLNWLVFFPWILGGIGTVGAALVRELLAKNAPVTLFAKGSARPEKYKLYMDTGFFSHLDIYDLLTKRASYDARHPFIPDVIEILLGRKPETLEKFIFKNKHHFE
ncbi:hypothetical protein CU097_002337 [Rhizopus azygosporus]|uniref:Uncharacterized protein n=2 Tax=Rhizopus TaxID=4842 RepID=A0A367IUL5_RHIAZ|nr:hypothetical protein CU097_002337 [Rhizopus azygosporus]